MSEQFLTTDTLNEPSAIYVKHNSNKPEPHFIDTMDDWAFKRIFGSEDSKEIMVTFLNYVLKGKRKISSINYSKNEHPGDIKELGAAVIDIVCKDIQGNTFLIEVQKAKQKYFKDRTLFYAARLISDQAPKGNRNKRKYKLKDVYVVSILEQFVLDKNASNNWYHHVSMVDEATGKLFYDKLGFTYIELINFDKAEHELSTDLEKWLYAIKHMKTLKSKPKSFTDPKLVKLFSIARYTNLSPEEKNMYNDSQKIRWDNQNALDYAKELGEAKGKHEKAVEMALKLIAKGMPADEISELTNLTVEEIQAL